MELLVKEINTDLHANEIYEIWKHKEDTAFLDSSKEESTYSKYSFIGINNFIKVKSKGNLVYINDSIKKGSIFDSLNYIIKDINFNLNNEEYKEIPFISGAIGYFSYDMGKRLENIKERSTTNYDIYDSYFLFFHNLVIVDLKEKKVYISCLYNTLEECEESFRNIKSSINKHDKACKNRKEVSVEQNLLESNFTRESYISAVEKMKNYILEGHIYIANMTQRFTCQCNKDSYEIYNKLRKINKAPFSAFLNFDHIEVMSSSPERFLNVIDGVVETRPIKGTRPRGATTEEDEFYKNELINSEKDKSELLMIVDLERNDLSKVCKPKSIKVTELFKLEEYDTVFHLVSTIVGELDNNKTAVDCIKACFPGGSITGAPKIRSMEVIEELEGVKRGLYTGAIGYFDLRGNCDFNIVIRTIVKKNNKAYFGVGGGVTIESIAEDEYNETLDKAKALIEVLK